MSRRIHLILVLIGLVVVWEGLFLYAGEEALRSAAEIPSLRQVEDGRKAKIGLEWASRLAGRSFEGSPLPRGGSAEHQ